MYCFYFFFWRTCHIYVRLPDAFYITVSSAFILVYFQNELLDPHARSLHHFSNISKIILLQLFEFQNNLARAYSCDKNKIIKRHLS